MSSEVSKKTLLFYETINIYDKIKKIFLFFNNFTYLEIKVFPKLIERFHYDKNF